MKKGMTELRKALDSTDAAALIPYDLEPILHEELLLLQPLFALLDLGDAGSKTHEFNVRTSHPTGWFEGESNSAQNTESTYARKTVQLKIQRIWGSVTGFTQTVTEGFIDAFETEVAGSLEGMSNTMEFGALWGTSDDLTQFTGDSYQYSGIIPRLFDDAIANVIDGGGNKITLDDLDQAQAKASRFRGARVDPYMWIMSTRMRQIADGLQTKAEIPLTPAQVLDGKITMASYDGYPILESDYIAPEGNTSPSLTSATAAAGGALADDDYFYNISSVTLYGEQEMGDTEQSASTAATNNSVDLVWTADTEAKLYMIWRGVTTGIANMQLLDIIPAKTYTNGVVSGNVGTYSDEGAKTPLAIKPLNTGEHNILLVNVNPLRGASFVGKVDAQGEPLDYFMTYTELAQVKDSYDFFIKSYYALKLVHPETCALLRHVTLS